MTNRRSVDDWIAEAMQRPGVRWRYRLMAPRFWLIKRRILFKVKAQRLWRLLFWPRWVECEGIKDG